MKPLLYQFREFHRNATQALAKYVPWRVQMHTPNGSETETILVVDDAEDIRKMVCAMLLQVGYRALEASEGQKRCGPWKATPIRYTWG